MRISHESCDVLLDVLWSHLAGIGLPFDQTLREYPDLAKALQELQERRPGLRPRDRGRGRPAHGRVVFREERIEDLPAKCTVAEVCRHLGVKKATVYKWVDKGLPVMSLNPSGSLLLDRGELLRWLDRTERLPAARRSAR